MAVDALTMDSETNVGARALGWMAPRRETREAGARLLDADPDLGRRLDPSLRDRLTPLLRVRIEDYDVGPWRPAALDEDACTLGLLVLDGLLLRDLSVQGRCCAELLGPGDLLRPGPGPDGSGSVPAEFEWQVVDGPARVAVIDGQSSAIVGRFPALMCELLDRAVDRARTLQLQLALTQVNGIGLRIELLLWHLADRWGRVTRDGIVLPLNITHEMLGRLIGARRPSVTTALRQLHDDGHVVRRGDAWVLAHDARPDAALTAA